MTWLNQQEWVTDRASIGEGTTNISEEIYKCSDGQVNKAVKYSREVFKGENEKKIILLHVTKNKF